MNLRSLNRMINKIVKQPRYALGVAIKRAKAMLAYKRGTGKSPLPESVTFFLTPLCNLHCKMCGQWGEEGTFKCMPAEELHKQLSLAEMISIVNELAPAKPSFTMFGGEPLLHDGCIELIEYIHKKGMHTLMITNGSLFDKYAEALVDAGLDELNVSLDGYGALHDQIRGMSGLFDTIYNGLKKVQEAKKLKGKKKPLINLQCTMMKDNYTQLDGIIRAAEELDVNSVTFHNLIFLGNDLIESQAICDQELDCNSDAWKGFVFDPDVDPEKLYAQIEKIKEGKYKFAVDFYPNFSEKGIKEYYENPCFKPSEYKARCLSPWIVAYVFNDGQIRPCLNSTYSFGSVYDSSFKNIWNSSKAIKYRQMLKLNGIFPACVRCTELYRY